MVVDEDHPKNYYYSFSQMSVSVLGRWNGKSSGKASAEPSGHRLGSLPLHRLFSLVGKVRPTRRLSCRDEESARPNSMHSCRSSRPSMLI